MRFVVHGVGAIGGTVAAALALTGQDVVGIARGRQLEAIRGNGLRLRTPDGDALARFECAAAPEEIAFGPDDVILLATKTQDTETALEQLRIAGVADQPIFCAQNGVENERLALRRFPNVHGVNVMLPAEYTVPGEVAAFGTPNHGIFDIGRYPNGADDTDTAVAEALTKAKVATTVMTNVMHSKYGKLILNLGNIVEAALGASPDNAPITSALRAEGETVLTAAGIAWQDVGLNDPRRGTVMSMGTIPGMTRIGSSSTQSLVRGAGSIETDYLNGEIALLARQTGVAAPMNEWFARHAFTWARTGIAHGSISRDEVKATLGL